MARRHLTERVLKSLRTSKVQEDVYDTSLRGFGVRVSRAGRRNFFLRYRMGGRNRRIDLGLYGEVSLDDARKAAEGHRGDLSRGLDPAAEQDRLEQGLSFPELAAEYVRRHAKERKRTWKEDERKIERDLLPAWGALKAAGVRKADVIAVLDAVVDRGSPGAANRLLALIRKIFNWGLERDLVEVNPCAGLKPPSRSRSRDRVLSASEIKALWEALEEESAPVRAAIRLLLLTAQRSIEVRSMRWQDVDGDVWRIPAEVVKGKRPHAVPLSVQVQAILATQRAVATGEWVIPSPKRPGQPLNGSALSHVPPRLGKHLGFDWWVHDLRRTAATHMATLGVGRFVIRQVLNHADPSVTAIYDRHSYLPEMREALVLWGAHLEELVRGTGDSPNAVHPEPHVAAP